MTVTDLIDLAVEPADIVETQPISVEPTKSDKVTLTLTLPYGLTSLCHTANTYYG